VWTLTADVEEYLAAAGAFVAARAVENTTLLTVAETVRVRGAGAFGETPPLFGWWSAGGEVAGAFVHTPPYPLGPTTLPEAAIPALAAALAGRPLSGVNGPAEVARAFASAWGVPATVRRREWLYRLRTLTPPPLPPGRAVAATTERLDLLVAWMAAFLGEIGEPPDSARRQVDNRLAHGGLTLWEHDRAPVSLAGLSLPVAGTVRVGPVYTPPEHRGRGFGAAVTAAVSRAALDNGAAEVVLFVDAANPISSRLYRRLGFEPVQERLFLAFAED
jgi:RimJ/RimL family protein N-acetyltransferase